MVDKLDLRLPQGGRFSREMEDIVVQLRHGPVPPFRSSKYYSYVGDLRESHNIDAVLHLGYKFGRGGKADSKLEVIDAGKKTVIEMEQTVLRVVDADVSQLQFMRLDLAGDIVGVPVHVFRECARFLYKQFASRIEKSTATELEFVAMGTADAQTIYAGRRPNFVRIYNKIKEWFGQWLKLKQRCERFNRGMKGFSMSAEQRHFGVRFCPTFEEFCIAEGFAYQEGATLTRIERQISGQRFPEELRVFGDLRRAHLYNPFTSLRIVPSEAIRCFTEPPKGVSIRDWLAVSGLNTLMRDLGRCATGIFVRS